MKKTALLGMMCLLFGGYATKAEAQQKSPDKKFRILQTKEKGDTIVYQYNSLEEMRADKRLQGIEMLLLSEKEATLDQLRKLEAYHQAHPGSAGESFVRVYLKEDSAKGQTILIRKFKGENSKPLWPLDKIQGEPAKAEGSDVLMHRSFKPEELPAEVEGLLKEQGIELKEGQQVVITRIIEDMLEPPLPPHPTEAPAAPTPPAVPELEEITASGLEAVQAPPAEVPDWLEELVVYPNPGEGQLRLRFKSANSGPAVLRLLDLNGKLVWEEKIPEAGNSFEKRLEVPDGKKGMFLLQIEQGGRKYSERVLLK